MPHPILFLDDGGVMNDNSRRAVQWQQRVGEFFAPILGGTPAAWAEANRAVVERLMVEFWQADSADRFPDYAAYSRAESLVWLHGMCVLVDVPAPPQAESLALADRANAYVTPRVRAAFPGAIEAIRALYAQGYTLHTASGGGSAALHGYLEGMGVRVCFGRLYGPDLVQMVKGSPEYYARIFADAGVDPAGAVVVDDRPAAVQWAAQAGARAVLVGAPAGAEPPAAFTIGSLAELPQVIKRLE